jgi:hypothetical protein
MVSLKIWKKKKDKKEKTPRKPVPSRRCKCFTMEDIRMLHPGYAKAAEYSQFFLTSGKGTNLRRLLVQLGLTRQETTKFFRLFMKIDEDDSGMLTLDEFFKYLDVEWNPFIGKAFHQFDTDDKDMSADQLEPDEWIVGMLNYCTLTPEALVRKRRRTTPIIWVGGITPAHPLR